jgi:hypothetical protein
MMEAIRHRFSLCQHVLNVTNLLEKDIERGTKGGRSESAPLKSVAGHRVGDERALHERSS